MMTLNALKVVGEKARFELSNDGVLTAFIPFTKTSRVAVKAAVAQQGLAVVGEHVFRDKTVAFVVKADLKAELLRLDERLAKIEEVLKLK